MDSCNVRTAWHDRKTEQQRLFSQALLFCAGWVADLPEEANHRVEEWWEIELIQCIIPPFFLLPIKVTLSNKVAGLTLLLSPNRCRNKGTFSKLFTSLCFKDKHGLWLLAEWNRACPPWCLEAVCCINGTTGVLHPHHCQLALLGLGGNPVRIYLGASPIKLLIKPIKVGFTSS